MHGLPVPNIVRGGVFIVSEGLDFCPYFVL
jgi:hypothetical protein